MVIVKVQYPISASDGNYSKILVYNEDRTIQQEMPEPVGLRRKMKQGKGALYDGKKNFFYARIEGPSIVIGHIAPWQDW